MVDKSSSVPDRIVIAAVEEGAIFPTYVDQWESDTYTVTAGAALEISPIENQVFIRIVPLSSGNFRYNFTNAVNDTNSEAFSSQTPLSIKTATAVFLRRDTGLADGTVVVYQGAKAPSV